MIPVDRFLFANRPPTHTPCRNAGLRPVPGTTVRNPRGSFCPYAKRNRYVRWDARAVRPGTRPTEEARLPRVHLGGDPPRGPSLPGGRVRRVWTRWAVGGSLVGELCTNAYEMSQCCLPRQQPRESAAVGREPDLDRTIVELHQQGYGTKDTAYILSRTEKSIRYRRRKLGLTGPKPEPGFVLNEAYDQSLRRSTFIEHYGSAQSAPRCQCERPYGLDSCLRCGRWL